MISTSTTTIQNEEHSEWKSWIGRRVCIGTVKQGILRYFGETQFAEGLWCGVELDEPIGKNDGSVKGVRYFYCQDNHGIFAPLSKIEKDLSSELSRESLDIRQLPSKMQCSEIKSKLPPPKITFKSFIKDNRNSCSENDDITVGDATFSKFPKGGMNETVIAYKKRTNDISFSIPSKITRLSSFHPQVLEAKECDAQSKYFISATSNANCFTNKVTLARKRSLPINVSYSVRTHGQYLDQGTEDSKNAKELLNRTVSLSDASYCDDVFARESELGNLNTTFSTNHEICGEEALNSTFSLLPSGDIISDANEKDDNNSEHNRTFTVDEIQQTARSLENATPSFLNKLKGSEEDLVSFECDESLGILTPSQMKDFTVCTDYQAPLLDAANLIRIPKMESCDDINDIPEDEIIQNISPGFSPIEDIREVQSIFPGNGIHFESTGTESSASPSPEIKLKDFLHESFECSQKKDDTTENNFSSGSIKTSTPFSSNQNVTVKNAYLFTEELLDQNKSSEHNINFIGQDCSYQEHCCPTNSHNLLEIKNIVKEKSFTNSSDNLSGCGEKLDDESLPHHDFLNVTVSATYDQVGKCEKSEKNLANSNMDKNTVIMSEIKHNSLENLEEKHEISVETVYENFHGIKLSSPTDEKSVSTNLSHPPNFHGKPAEITELHLGQMVLKKERPASTYTIGSTDTGYQGDGEFDNQSEPGIATVESPCDENMKQSMHDSCIGTDYSHSERNQKSDIMTDSDFYTDSGGVGMTESEIELDGECKDLNRTFDKPFSALGDADNQLDYLNDVEKNTMNVTEESSCIDFGSKTITSDINVGLSQTENALSSTFEIVKTDTHDEPHKHMNDTFNSAEHSNICFEPEEKEKCANTVTEQFTNLREKNSLTFSESKFQEKDNANAGLFSVQKSQPAKKSLSLNISEAAKVRQPTDNNRNSIARAPKKSISKFKPTTETNKLLNKVVDKNDLKPTQRKNSKWDAVTSKIAASLADEKTKVRTRKEIKSRIDTNLTATRYSIAKKSPKPNSDSTSILTENENNCNKIENGSKLVKNVINSQRFQDGKENVQQFTFAEPEIYGQNNINQTLGHGEGHSKPDKLPITKKNQGKKRFESYPHSYPLSPGAKSESSTVSLASYSSKASWHSSKIAVLKNRKASVGSIGALSRHHDSSKPPKLFAAKTVPLRAAPRKSFLTKEVAKKATPVSAPPSWRPTGQPPVTPTTTTSTTIIRSACLPKTSPASQSSRNLSKDYPLNKGGRLLPTHRPLAGPEPKKSTWVSKAELTQEIQHLGALCESRTKELNMLKMQLKHAALGFEAFGVLSQYLTEELDAFSHPKFVAELHRTQHELNKAGSQLQVYQKQLEELKVTHAHEIIVLTEKLGQAHREEIDALKQRQREELVEVEALHKDQVASLKKSLISALEEVEKKHADVLKEMNNDFQKHKEEMQRMHAQQLEETQHTHKATEASLCNKLEELQKQYDILQQQAKQAEEAFLRDKNSKTQWIKAKKSDLEKEVESLKTVLEMKSTEIHALRRENLEMKKELEELPKAKETIRKLEAKKEDLQALIKEKVCVQGQITSEHHQLAKELEKESKVKERLSMENEALQWRLQQSMEASYILQSLAASQDLRDEFAREGYVKIPNRSRCSLPVLFGDTDMDRSEMFPPDIMSVSVPSYTPSPKRTERSTSFTASWHPALSTQAEPAFFSPINEYRKPRSASERPFLSGSAKSYLRRTSQNFRHIPKKEKDSFKKEDSVLNTLRLGRQKLNIPLEKMEDANENSAPTSVVDEKDNNQAEASSDSTGVIQEVLEFLVNKCEKESKPCITKEANNMCHIDKLSYDIPPVIGDKCVNTKLCSISDKVSKQETFPENRKIRRDEFMKLPGNTLQREEWSGEFTNTNAASQSEIFRHVQETLSPELSEAEQEVIAFVKEVDVQEGSLVSTSLQSSLNSSDDSSWSIPLQHATQHSVSPGEDSSSSYSSKSQEGGSLAEHSDDKSSCGDMMGPSEDRHYISSPRSLAGEAMILDDSTASHGHTPRFFLDVSCDLLTEGPLDEMECRDISSSPEEIKGKIVNHICSETPSMETSSQGMLLTDSTNMDVSWGEDEMPSEADV